LHQTESKLNKRIIFSYKIINVKHLQFGILNKVLHHLLKHLKDMWRSTKTFQ